MKHIVSHLMELPEGYRERALKNYNPTRYTEPVNSIDEAINYGFRWYGTPEDQDFWSEVCEFYENHNPGIHLLPELPS